MAFIKTGDGKITDIIKPEDLSKLDKKALEEALLEEKAKKTKN